MGLLHERGGLELNKDSAKIEVVSLKFGATTQRGESENPGLSGEVKGEEEKIRMLL